MPNAAATTSAEHDATATPSHEAGPVAEQDQPMLEAVTARAASPGADGVDLLGGVDSGTRVRMMMSMQSRAGNAAMQRMVQQNRPAAPPSHTTVQRDNPPATAPAAAPAGGAPGVGLSEAFELAEEIPGAKVQAGYIKLNKTSFKFKGKISQDTPGGTPAVGPSAGSTSKDGSSAGSLAISAEAKQVAKSAFMDYMNQVGTSAVQAVAGKDKTLKAEVWNKMKAEAKAGAKESSAKIAYDVGVDVAISGVPKLTLSVSFTLAGLKFKKGELPKPTAMAFAPTAALSVKLQKPVGDGGQKVNLEGTGEISMEFEPNWAIIAKDAAIEIGIDAAIEAAGVAALIIGPMFVMGSGIMMAGEKGALHAKFLEGAQDAKSGAMVYAQIMTGSDVPAGKGPRSQAAAARGKADIAAIAAGQAVGVEDLMTELRQGAPGAFTTVLGPAKQQAQSAFDSDVRATIAAWRSEHPILSIWTTADIDFAEAEKMYAPLFN